jgi:hypothetical protein
MHGACTWSRRQSCPNHVPFHVSTHVRDHVKGTTLHRPPYLYLNATIGVIPGLASPRVLKWLRVTLHGGFSLRRSQRSRKLIWTVNQPWHGSIKDPGVLQIFRKHSNREYHSPSRQSPRKLRTLTLCNIHQNSPAPR